jgi:5-formyltetrahydrofolate cyclo-ligase
MVDRYIPDFAGADLAAVRLSALPVWKSAAVIKAMPDRAQEPVRRRALQDGKLVYMAAPKAYSLRSFRASRYMARPVIGQRSVVPDRSERVIGPEELVRLVGVPVGHGRQDRQP